MSIEWKKSYEIGVPEVDKQHEELFAAVNRLLDACNQGKGREEVESVIGFLEKYVITHFSTEERLQKRSGYPEYDRHKELHDNFIGDFTRLKEEISKEGINARTVIVVNRKVVDWLTGHIRKEDKKLGKFLSQKESQK
mgnify:CR=1 FL=1